MNRYKFKITYNTGRTETYEIEAAKHIDAYTVLLHSAFLHSDDDEILFKIELIELHIIWKIDEDE